MNTFLDSAVRLISKYGSLCAYIRVTEGAYDDNTLTTTNTEVGYFLSMYKESMKVSNYNFPNLIGKDVVRFYIAASSLGFRPSVKDRIQRSSDIYTIDSFVEDYVGDLICLYRVVAVKG